MEWKVIGYAGKDAEEVDVEVSNGYLCSITSMASWWNELELHFVFVAYDIFHVFGDFVVEHMLFGDYSCPLQAHKE